MVGFGGKADGPHVLVQDQGLVQLHQRHVVVVGDDIVQRVSDDPANAAPDRPLVCAALSVQPQEHLPLVSIGEPERQGFREREGLKKDGRFTIYYETNIIIRHNTYLI